MTGARNYRVCRVHPISGREIDTGRVVELSEADLSSRKQLGKRLRRADVLPAGRAVEHFRREGENVSVFPRSGGEARLFLMATKPSSPCLLCQGDPRRREGVACWGCGEPSQMG